MCGKAIVPYTVDFIPDSERKLDILVWNPSSVANDQSKPSNIKAQCFVNKLFETSEKQNHNCVFPVDLLILQIEK